MLLSMLKTVVLLSGNSDTFLVRILWWIERTKEQHLF